MAKTQVSFTEEVERLLRDHFTNANVIIGINPGAERVSGQLVTPDFIGMEHIDRQKMVRDVLRKTLKKKAEGVSIILAYTPDEYAAMSA